MCFFPCAAVAEIIVMRLVRTKPLYHLTALTKPMSTGTDMRLDIYIYIYIHIYIYIYIYIYMLYT
jgi:hypothetical protein